MSESILSDGRNQILSLICLCILVMSLILLSLKYLEPSAPAHRDTLYCLASLPPLLGESCFWWIILTRGPLILKLMHTGFVSPFLPPLPPVRPHPFSARQHVCPALNTPCPVLFKKERGKERQWKWWWTSKRPVNSQLRKINENAFRWEAPYVCNL